jgi:hypothetical protein
MKSSNSRFNTFFLSFVLALSFAVAVVPASAASGNKEIQAAVAGMSEAQRQARAEQIKLRVEEIKSMDKSQLTSAEKKELRSEMKMMRKEAKAMGGGGIYISLAGILIIILLLIIIL